MEIIILGNYPKAKEMEKEFYLIRMVILYMMKFLRMINVNEVVIVLYFNLNMTYILVKLQ